MRFKLPRQIINREIVNIVSRLTKVKKPSVSRVSKNNLRITAKILREIKKEGLPKGLVCKKLPKGLGHGIFLHPKAKPILRDQIIAPYSGEVFLLPQNQEESGSDYIFGLISEVLLTKEEQFLVDRGSRYHPQRFYSLDLDAGKKGNFTRFINHSEEPNIVARLVRIPKNRYGLAPMPLEIIYIAKKTIRPGEQLLVCYEDEKKSYWGIMKIKPLPINPKTFMLSPSLRVLAIPPQTHSRGK